MAFLSAGRPTGESLRESVIRAEEHRLRAPSRSARLERRLWPARSKVGQLPLPEDPRARRVADALLRDPADARTLAAFGKHAGASARTLARLFLAETGAPFGQWRAHLRLCAALSHLAVGVPVGDVAGRVGYASASAFVAAFRRLLGVSPGAYFVG